MRALTLLVLVSFGCGHVHVPPLPAQITPEQRLDVWRHWHSRGQGIETTTSCGGGGGCSTSQTAILQLEGDVEVRHPEDLRPLIDERSASGRALQKLEDERSSRIKWQLIAVAGALGFLAAAIRMYQTGDEDWLIYGGGASAAVALVGGVGVWIKNRDILEASIETYDHYDESLLQRLNLCVRGLTIVPCELETPGTMSVPVEGAAPVIEALPQR